MAVVFLLATTFFASEVTLGVAEELSNRTSSMTVTELVTTTPQTSANRSLIYDALRLLDPNTLNMTIYWHCVSTDYVWLSEFGDFQKNDTNYQKCEAEGHFLFERSCLHNLLVPSTCFDGIWNCGSKWLNNTDYTMQWIRNTAKVWPQCFTGYNSTGSYALTWDCEERCDLPCDYPEEFCTTIKTSYNFTRCELDCTSVDRQKDRPSDRRLSSGLVHGMQLKFGNSESDIPLAAPTSAPIVTPSTKAPSENALNVEIGNGFESQSVASGVEKIRFLCMMGLLTTVLPHFLNV
jgi:hypothetical protein